ncbi:MAG: DUF4116 domain-containing protein [Gammaproteobacteria bacterium]|nr:DUF4116 domain-containing protein [Gammaproteobacteria bacterium]MCH9762908.1 DUF4116 domain-containing protein [Gammaproteobacteria bacterium]
MANSNIKKNTARAEALRARLTESRKDYEELRDRLIKNLRDRKTVLNDKEAALSAVRINGLALQFASDKLRNDPDVVAAAINNDEDAIFYASKTRQICFLARSDVREDVLDAVKQDGLALQYASDTFKNDRGVVAAAFTQNAEALDFASDGLKVEEKFIVDLKTSALVDMIERGQLKLNEPTLLKRDKANKVVVMAAVKQDGLALQYASEELRGDPEVVKAAITQNDAAERHSALPQITNSKMVAIARLDKYQKEFALQRDDKSDVLMTQFITEQKEEVEKCTTQTAINDFNEKFLATLKNLKAHQAQVKALEDIISQNKTDPTKAASAKQAMLETPIAQRNSEIAPKLKKALNENKEYKVIRKALRMDTKTTRHFKDAYKNQRALAEKEQSGADTSPKKESADRLLFPRRNLS